MVLHFAKIADVPQIQRLLRSFSVSPFLL